MPNTLQEISRNSILSSTLRHPTVWLPPNVATQLVVSGAMTGLVGPFPQALSLVADRQTGTAQNATVNVTTGAGFTGSMSITVLVEGLDENWEPTREIITCVGTGAASQAFSGQILFSVIDSISVLGVTGGAAGSGASFSVGIGDGSATHANGGKIAIPHPVPGLPASQIRIIPQNSALSARLLPAEIGLSGRSLIFSGPSTGYGAGATVRVCAVLLFGVDGRSLR